MSDQQQGQPSNQQQEQPFNQQQQPSNQQQEQPSNQQQEQPSNQQQQPSNQHQQQPSNQQQEQPSDKQPGCLCICNSCICVCCGLGLTDSEDSNKNYFQQVWTKHGWQLLKNPWKKIEKYVDPVISNYFSFLHLLFVWLLIVFFLGLIFFAFSFYTLHDNVNPANPVCNANFSEFYMCPLCDNDCDFWYLKVYLVQQKECTRRYRLIVDNPLMWVYCTVVLISALVLSCCVLFKTSSKPLKFCETPSSESQQDTVGLVNDHPCDHHCLMFFLFIWTAMLILLLIGLFFGVFLANLFIEKQIRKTILNNYGISDGVTSSFIRFFAQSLLAIFHGVLNLSAKNVYENIVQFTGILSNKYYKFFYFWIYNSCLAYFPILFRIFLYGQITGDPEVGYSNIGDLRFQHCPSYGCIDVGIYVFFFIVVSVGGSPTLSLLGKMIWNRDNQYKKNTDDSCCNNCCSSCTSSSHCCSCCAECCKKCCTSCMNCCQSCCSCVKSCYSFCIIGPNDVCFERCTTDDKCKKFCSVCGITKFCLSRLEDDIVNHYVELSILYGYIIFFLTATGIAPLLASVIILPIIARRRSMYYAEIWESSHNKSHKDYEKSLQELASSSNMRNIWSIVFFAMTLFAMWTNFAIIIPNSRFIQHVAYSGNMGHGGPLLNFDGYLNDVFPKHNLTTLIQSGIFPHYTSHHLAILYQNGETVRNSTGEPILYLPFVNFACLQRLGHSNFTRDQYIQYISSSPMNNHIISYDRNSKPISYGECFNTTATCRSRGILRSNEVYDHILHVRQLFLLLFVLSAILLVVGLLIGLRICCKLSK